MLPRKPRNLPAMPKGYTYLGKGESFKTNGMFSGYSDFAAPNGWRKYEAMNGWLETAHYCAPTNSEIVKLNGGAPKRKKKKVEPIVFNKFKYYGVETNGSREILIANSYGSRKFCVLCQEQFSNYNGRFGSSTFDQIVEYCKEVNWKIKVFNTFAELCLWLADHPASKKVYS